MHSWFFVYSSKILYKRDNMKDQFQPSLRKLANNVPAAGSVLLFGDDLADHIRSLNDTTSLRKPTKMISNWEVFGKNPQNISSPPEEALLMARKGTLPRATRSPVAIQLGIIVSRNKSDTKNTDWLSGSLSYLWFVTKSWMFHSWKYL